MMTRGDREFQKRITVYRAPSPDEDRKAQAKAMARAVLAKKPLSMGKPFRQLLLEQAEYISPVTWALQAGAFAVLCFLGAGTGSISTLGLAAAVIPFLGVVGVSEIAKSYSCSMWELEMSCRYNLKSIFAMKMLLTGLGSGICLLTAFGLAYFARESSLPVIALTVVTPFCLSNAVYLQLLIRLQRKCTNYVLAGAAVFLTVFQVWLCNFLETESGQQLATAGVSFAAVILSAAAFAVTAGRLIKQGEKGCGQWNCI